MKINNNSLILLIISISILSINVCQAQSKTESSIIGKWITHDDKAIIEIFQEGNIYSGVIDSVLVTTPIESLIGLTILKDFSLKKNKYIGGTMYDPESGGTYECKLWLENNDTLKVRDYCGLFFMTFTWKRLK